MHRQFHTTLTQCFDTNRPTEYETGVTWLTAEKLESRNEPSEYVKELLQDTRPGYLNKFQLDTGDFRPEYVNDLYSDTRPIYMPPAAADAVRKIQHRKEQEALEREK